MHMSRVNRIRGFVVVRVRGGGGGAGTGGGGGGGGERGNHFVFQL